MLLFKSFDVFVYIYKTLPADISRYVPLERLDPNELNNERVEAYKSKIKLVLQLHCMTKSDLDLFEKLKDWIAKFYVKYENNKDNMKISSPFFEKEFLLKFNSILIIFSKGFHWNIFLGKKIEKIIKLKPSEKYLEIELDFPQYQAKKHKKTLILFQKIEIKVPFWK